MKVDPTVSILTSRGVLIAQTFLALTATLVLSRNFRELTGNLGAAIYAVFLVSLLFLSLLYIYNMHRRKLHRYCRAIPHLHYVNHIIRDTLAALKLGKDEFESESIDQNRQYLSTQLSNVLT
ncbi:MAG: hypothetical protein U0984_02595, partial [Prosthecobacter sp.]|nr:hypothetical protein [Prosthecobacter sp.]